MSGVIGKVSLAVRAAGRFVTSPKYREMRRDGMSRQVALISMKGGKWQNLADFEHLINRPVFSPEPVLEDWDLSWAIEDFEPAFKPALDLLSPSQTTTIRPQHLIDPLGSGDGIQHAVGTSSAQRRWIGLSPVVRAALGFPSGAMLKEDAQGSGLELQARRSAAGPGMTTGPHTPRPQLVAGGGLDRYQSVLDVIRKEPFLVGLPEGVRAALGFPYGRILKEDAQGSGLELQARRSAAGPEMVTGPHTPRPQLVAGGGLPRKDPFVISSRAERREWGNVGAHWVSRLLPNRVANWVFRSRTPNDKA